MNLMNKMGMYAVGASLVCASILTGCLTPSANAARFDYLKKSVLADIKPEDVESFKKVVVEVLEKEPDYKTVYWTGDSGLKGKMQSELSYRSDGNPCRRMRFAFHNAHNKKEYYKFDLCKLNKKWQFMDTPLQNFSEQEIAQFDRQLIFALDEGKEGHPISWTLPEKQSGGVIVPINIDGKEGENCRQAAISIFDKTGRTSDGKYIFCKSAKHGWERQRPNK